MPDHTFESTGAKLGRRTFLEAGLALPLAGAGISPRLVAPGVRNFGVQVQLDLVEARGEVRVWVPLVLTRATAYQRLIAQRWTASTPDIAPCFEGDIPGEEWIASNDAHDVRSQAPRASRCRF